MRARASALWRLATDLLHHKMSRISCRDPPTPCRIGKHPPPALENRPTIEESRGGGCVVVVVVGGGAPPLRGGGRQVAPTPPPFCDNAGDPQLPAALQDASSTEASAQAPSQQPLHAPHQPGTSRRSIAGHLKLPMARRDQGKALTPTRCSLRRCQNHPQPNRRDISRASHR